MLRLLVIVLAASELLRFLSSKVTEIGLLSAGNKTFFINNTIHQSSEKQTIEAFHVLSLVVRTYQINVFRIVAAKNNL